MQIIWKNSGIDNQRSQGLLWWFWGELLEDLLWWFVRGFVTVVPRFVIRKFVMVVYWDLLLKGLLW